MGTTSKQVMDIKTSKTWYSGIMLFLRWGNEIYKMSLLWCPPEGLPDGA